MAHKFLERRGLGNFQRSRAFPHKEAFDNSLNLHDMFLLLLPLEVTRQPEVRGVRKGRHWIWWLKSSCHRRRLSIQFYFTKLRANKTKKKFFSLVFVFFFLVCGCPLLAVRVITAAEAALLSSGNQRRHVGELVLEMGHVGILVREDVESHITHGILAASQTGLLTLGEPLGLALGDRQQLLHLLLGDTEGVVADAQSLLEDVEALEPAHRHRRVVVLPGSVGQEVGAQSEGDAHGEVRVAEDAVHLDGRECLHGLRLAAVPSLFIDAEHALPSGLFDGSSMGIQGAVVRNALFAAHVRLARLELAQALVVVDGLPREEVHAEGRPLALLQSLEDLGLALKEHLHQPLLQEVGVGRDDALLLLLLLLLEELHHLALARLSERGKERRVLDGLEERSVLSGERVGQVERGHDCLLEGERKCASLSQ
jgi:hypothetical protein